MLSTATTWNSTWNTNASTSITISPGTSTGSTLTWASPNWTLSSDRYWVPDKLPAEKRTLELPDGAKLEIDDQGNYRIEDKDAKVTHRANRMRDFSPHLNASDMLAAFVKYVRGLGVRKAEVLRLPLELFVSWLIVEAAERDKDPVPADVVRVEQHGAILEARRPKCLSCGRYIPRLYYQNRFPFCGPEHGAKFVERRLIA